MTWPLVRLGDLAEFINGAAFKPDDWGDSGLPIVRIQNLTNPSKPYNRTLRAVSDRVRVRQGELLVSWSATLGVFEWDRDEDGLVNQHIFRVVPDESLVQRAYLRHMLSDALLAMKKHAHGATMLHVNRGEFLMTTIPLPPLPEQRRIASILDQTSELSRQARFAITRLGEIRLATFRSLFTSVRSSTQASPLGEVADFFAGSSLPAGVPFVNQEGGSLLVKVSDMNRTGNERRIHTASLWSASSGSVASTAPTGSVVIPKRGGAISTNKKRLLARRSVLDPNLMAIAAKDGVILPSYLSAWFDDLDLKTLISGSSVPQLNKRDLAPLQILVPSMAVQELHRDVADSVASATLLVERRVQLLDELFASLQHRAFEGTL